MQSDEAVMVKELLAAARETMAGLSIPERREMRDNLPQPLPDGTIMRPIDAGGVPGEWLARRDAVTGQAVLYLHGGGFVVGSPRSHRRLAALVGAAAGADCLVADFRLAPEHPHPAALDDAVTAYRWLAGELGSAAGIVVAGDSAGGGLALATLLALREAGDRLPAAAVLLSPWVDLALHSESIRTRREADVILSEASLREAQAAYAGDRDLTDPAISPLYGDLQGLPPLLIQVGDAELVRDDAVRLAQKALAAGVPATLEIWPEMPHVFPTFAGSLPEADAAIDRIGSWLRACAGLAAATKRGRRAAR